MTDREFEAAKEQNDAITAAERRGEPLKWPKPSVRKSKPNTAIKSKIHPPFVQVSAITNLGEAFYSLAEVQAISPQTVQLAYVDRNHAKTVDVIPMKSVQSMEYRF